MTALLDPRNAMADRLYKQYVRPLETQYHGEFIGVAPDGRYVVAGTALDAMRQATAAFGRGNYIFKIGDRVVGKWR
jgi:hypothetical protein